MVRYKKDPSHVGSKIRIARLAAGMSQAKLGKLIGVAYQQIQKYEKGESELTLSRLKQLCSVLSLPLSFFIDDTNNLTTSEDQIRYCELSKDELRLITLLRQKGDRKLVRKLIETISMMMDTGKGTQ